MVGATCREPFDKLTALSLSKGLQVERLAQV